MMKSNVETPAMSEAAKAARNAYNRKWRQDHQEARNAYNRQWRKDHPDRVREYNRRRWEKIAEQSREHDQQASDVYSTIPDRVEMR